MRTLVALPFILALALTACDSSSSGGSSNGPDADGFVSIPNIGGMKVKVPDGVKPNGVGGAAGFHTDDDSFQFVLQEVNDDKSFDAAKTDAEQILFKKWINSEKTDDGWVLTYEVPKLDADMNEAGTMYAFEVRRKVGDKSYKCYGSIAKADGLDAVVNACKSIKAG